jgi:hypothetical protein
MELEGMSIACQRLYKHVSATRNTYVTIEKMLETVFSIGSDQKTSKMSDSNESLVVGPRRGLTPKLTGRLNVGRNVTLTFA